jgi:hypothetical protein
VNVFSFFTFYVIEICSFEVHLDVWFDCLTDWIGGRFETVFNLSTKYFYYEQEKSTRLCRLVFFFEGYLFPNAYVFSNSKADYKQNKTKNQLKHFAFLNLLIP